ncbi:MAG: glycogen synthase GlgA [Gammaproteobacteria bacterium]|nr:glycogen synthase GlgA [Gammaproteobacteria bacterium]MCW8924473.1 glycogen synthase GlgA [Gammaproteobacteria bacterium]
MNKILYISSEAFPLIKTGGLADVAGSLPTALTKQSQDVRLLLPAYPEVLSKIRKNKKVSTTSYYNLSVEIIETRLPGSNIIVWLVDCPALFNRPGGPYTDKHGQAWHDNALRFAVFCHVAVDIALNKLLSNWQPDVVHCNDWQAGLVPALLSLHRKRPATVFTIHNLAYQGIFDQQTFVDLHLPEELWHINGLEFYGQLSFIKGGLAYADKITTVSPSYAREILQPEFGYSLDGLLNSRSKHLSGILNGIDEKHWNPGTDKYLEHKYNRRSLNKKSINKTELQQQLSLPVDASTMMIGMVSRLVQQKGLDIILQSLATLFTLPVQLVILGTGETHYELQLSEWAQRQPDQLKVVIGYNEPLAHRIEAASDVYLMPSTFEPCGLNQLYSLRYGNLPVVTPVGGLADTVTDASEENIKNDTANGFVINEQSPAALLSTIQRALTLYQQPEIWRQLQINAMSADFSWQASARRYISLYQQILEAH